MRYALPTGDDMGLAAQVSAHFARARYYTLVDDANGARVCMRVQKGEGGGKGRRLSELFRDWNVDVVLCGNLGSGAVRHMEAIGVPVFSGAHGSVADAIEEYRSGLLRAADASTACDQGRNRNETKDTRQ